MFLSLASVRRSPVRGIAMALALASGAAVVSTAIAPEAYAQRRGASGNSREFAAAYQPVAALVQGEAPNWAGARDQFETLVAQIKNEDDRHVAGSFALQIGGNLSDPVFQRRGLEMMLQSGKVAPEQIGQFNYFVGSLAYQAGDLAASRTALQAAIAAGHVADDPRGLILQTYLDEGMISEGLDFIEAEIASGTQPDESWFLRTLQESYNNELKAESLRASIMLVTHFPGQENWMKSLQVINALEELEPQAQLDLLRLMRATGAMTQRAEFVRYIENADPRIMGNEVLPLLAEGVAAGVFTAAPSDDYYTEVKNIADSRAPADRRALEATVREGQTGAALDASIAGNVLWSVADYARAETMYGAALEKGGNRDTLLTRIGMAQVMQGKYAEAVATLGQVEGARRPVAAMWATWAQEKLGG